MMWSETVLESAAAVCPRPLVPNADASLPPGSSARHSAQIRPGLDPGAALEPFKPEESEDNSSPPTSTLIGRVSKRPKWNGRDDAFAVGWCCRRLGSGNVPVRA